MQVTPLLASFVSILALSLAVGCDKKAEGDPSDSADAKPQSAEEIAAEKKKTVDALLQANGIDPATIGQASKSAPAGAGTQAGAVPGSQPVQAAQGAGKLATIEVVSSGSGPKQTLRYKFQKGAALKFSMDMKVTPKRSVNGQPMPMSPPVQIAMSGTSNILDVTNSMATRLNTFLEFTPGTDGLPPEVVQQMNAQFQGLKGAQLKESVNAQGQVVNMEIPPESANNPQIMALLQNLQDGMTNSYLPLPDQEVGVGAKWKATAVVVTAGLSITQVNEVHLKSLVGDKAVVEMTFTQSAPAQKISAAELPPGAEVELTGMKGGGKGTMTVDFATQVTDSKVDLNMTVDTKVSGMGAPAPVQSTTDTNMVIHMRVTK